MRRTEREILGVRIVIVAPNVVGIRLEKNPDTTILFVERQYGYSTKALTFTREATPLIAHTDLTENGQLLVGGYEPPDKRCWVQLPEGSIIIVGEEFWPTQILIEGGIVLSPSGGKQEAAPTEKRRPIIR